MVYSLQEGHYPSRRKADIAWRVTGFVVRDILVVVLLFCNIIANILSLRAEEVFIPCIALENSSFTDYYICYFIFV